MIVLFQRIINPWALLLGAFILGGIVAICLRKPILNFYQKFNKKSPIIRKYWSFVIIFFLTLGIIYWFVLTSYLSSENIQRCLDIVGQIATLIFATFVGYFAFLQLVEARIETLKKDGIAYLRDGQYIRAIKKYEEAYSIDGKDFDSLANLTEVYLIVKDFESYENKIIFLEKIALDKKDHLVCKYLIIASYLLRQRLSDADNEIKKLVVYKEKNPSMTVTWDFRDVKNGDTYKELKEGSEAKKKFDEMVGYLTNRLSPEDKTKFVSEYITLS